jgi:hypothetical protein
MGKSQQQISERDRTCFLIENSLQSIDLKERLVWRKTIKHELQKVCCFFSCSNSDND